MADMLIGMLKRGDISHREIQFLHHHMVDVDAAIHIPEHKQKDIARIAGRERINFNDLLRRAIKADLIQQRGAAIHINPEEIRELARLAHLKQLNISDLNTDRQMDLFKGKINPQMKFFD
ncbi:MAG TPA: hypothetical protein VJI13_01540 [Candidatus Norongarragalinales archaeon]|nr:hypothetical protein [Candidatus Norongarragalinales archaeon]